MPPRRRRIVEETPAPVEETSDPVEKTSDPVEEEEEGEEKEGEEEEGEEEEEEVLECTIRRRPPTTLTEEEEEDEEEEEVADVGSSTAKRATKRKARAKKVVPKLPEAPSFDNIFLHPKPSHGGHANLPPALLLGEALPPLRIFSLFFTDSILSVLAVNTNAYAAKKDAGLNEGARKWKDTTPGELRVFVGILIYLGVFVPKGSIEDLWSTSSLFPHHDICRLMTCYRFKQLKRCFHISSPHEPDEHWYSKLEPLSTKLSANFRSLYIPSTDVSVDEMIVRFSGRSGHTVKMKCKPTPEGYKIYALCESGYTYSFLYYSRISSVVGVKPIEGLNATSAAVVHLAKALPYEAYRFNIYMDNFFSNIPLFKHLRGLEIGACGTARINSKQFPPPLKVDKKLKYEWDQLSGAVVDDTVLAVVWVDNAPVPMLSTIHQITGGDARISRLRYRPRTTSTNAAHARAPFKGQHYAFFDIPKIIDDYNHKMNGVDLSDQFRSYYNTQLTVFRTWMPLFFWILDTTVVNSYRIYKAQGGTLFHKEFRINLAWSLATEGIQDDSPNIKATRQHHQKQPGQHTPSHKKIYVTKKRQELPALRLLHKGQHYPDKIKDTRPNCVFCRYNATVLEDKNYDAKTTTTWKCGFCDVPLCLSGTRNCYKEYHGIP